MGQYFMVVNLDKKQYLHPHHFGDGLKLCEFGSSGNGTMFALAALCSNGNGQGMGDIKSDSHLIGSWAGDRIVICGDYGEKGKWLAGVDAEDLLAVAKEIHTRPEYQLASEVNLYGYAEHRYDNISDAILEALCADDYYRDEFSASLKDSRGPGGYSSNEMHESLRERLWPTLPKKRKRPEPKFKPLEEQV